MLSKIKDFLKRFLPVPARTYNVQMQEVFSVIYNTKNSVAELRKEIEQNNGRLAKEAEESRKEAEESSAKLANKINEDNARLTKDIEQLYDSVVEVLKGHTNSTLDQVKQLAEILIHQEQLTEKKYMLLMSEVNLVKSHSGSAFDQIRQQVAILLEQVKQHAAEALAAQEKIAENKFALLAKEFDPVRKQLEELRTAGANLDRKADNINKLINNTQTRLGTLERKSMYEHHKSLPEHHYHSALCERFERAMKRPVNLSNPKTFNEKILWMILYDKNPLKTKLADKYAVREWVKEKIGEEYLIPLLGVWDTFDEIDFDALPDKFVLKCNHGWFMNILVKDKSELDLIATRKNINEWLNTNFAYRSLELQYREITPKIIAEEYLENNTEDDLYDYKFWCFNGKVDFICFHTERNSGARQTSYDTEWTRLPFDLSHSRLEYDIEKPKNLNIMIDIAERLAEDFNFVRVDLYCSNDGVIKFGEMTFTPNAGAIWWDPPEYDEIFGTKFEITQ